MNNNVYIVDIVRSPIGSYLGNLSNITISELGTQIIKNLLIKTNISSELIDFTYIGNVLSAGNGQNIARQISYNCSINTPSITVNNVCGSGMESIRQAYNSIILNEGNCILVGGIEHMSNTPYLNNTIKKGNKMGNINLIDSMINDGLTDPFSKKHMGDITNDVNIENNITKEESNNYAYMSYSRARTNNDKLKQEICPITIKNITYDTDEEINKIQDLNKIFNLKPVFGSTITAGNCSKLSDGCCFMLLCSEDFLFKNNIKPKAIIKNMDISIGNPNKFPLIPIKSVQNLCKKSNVDINNIDLFEVNEAFATVPIMFSKELNISYDKINIYGGAIALGHPLGCSGSRIVCTLINALINENKKIGCATICVGGGGAESILIEVI